MKFGLMNPVFCGCLSKTTRIERTLKTRFVRNKLHTRAADGAVRPTYYSICVCIRGSYAQLSDRMLRTAASRSPPVYGGGWLC